MKRVGLLSLGILMAFYVPLISPVFVSAYAEYTLFGNNSSGLSQANDTGAVNVCAKVRYSQAGGYIVGARIFMPPDTNGLNTPLTGIVAYVWPTDGIGTSTTPVLASQAFGTVTRNAWNEVRFAAPVPIVQDEKYCVGAYFPNGGYSAAGAFYDSYPGGIYTNAPLSSEYSYFAYGAAGSAPTGFFNSAWYGTDVIVADSEPSSPTGVMSTPTNINATVSEYISMTTSGSVALNITPSQSGQASNANDSVSITTNGASGFTLQLSDSDNDTFLASGGNSINAHSGTFGSPSSLALNTWGYRIDNQGGFGAGPTGSQTNVSSLSEAWAGIAPLSSPTVIRTYGSPGDSIVTTVWYGAYVDTATVSGSYTDTLVYTATSN